MAVRATERPSSRRTCATTCSSGSAEMVTDVMASNGLEIDDFISVVFTATSDLHSSSRRTPRASLGFGEVPLICARELEIAGSMPRVVRMMAHVETDLPRARHHPRLPARRRRAAPDLTRARSVPDESGA